MNRTIYSFFTALAFLTRLRLPVPEMDLGRAYGFFPLVGGLIGGMGGVVLLGAGMIGLPPLVAVLLGLGAMVLLTGALHEDGLADTADGLGAGADRQRALEIMKDSRIGSFGVLALMLTLGLKAAALLALAPVQGAVALIMAGALSRAVPPFLAALLPAARPGGLGHGAGTPRRGALLVVIGSVLAILAGIAWAGGVAYPTVAVLVAGVMVTGYGLGRLFLARLGGFTGDTLGAAQQVTELVVLLVLVAAP